MGACLIFICLKHKFFFPVLSKPQRKPGVHQPYHPFTERALGDSAGRSEAQQPKRRVQKPKGLKGREKSSLRTRPIFTGTLNKIWVPEFSSRPLDPGSRARSSGGIFFFSARPRSWRRRSARRSRRAGRRSGASDPEKISRRSIQTAG